MKALVLSGGGSKGAFEAGVLKQLCNSGYVPDAVYGTSAGALNAAGFAFAGIDKLLSVWQSIKDNSDIYVSKDIALPINAASDLIFGKGCGLFNHNPLFNLIKEVVVGKPTLPATVCRVSLATMGKQYVTAKPDGSFESTNEEMWPTSPQLSDFQEAVLSSTSIPIVFDLVHDCWGDGGVRANTPVMKAIADGATEIVLILTQPFQQNQPFPGLPGNVVDTAMRLFETALQELFVKDVNEALIDPNVKITLYQPATNLPETLTFSPEEIARQISMGETIQPTVMAPINQP